MTGEVEALRRRLSWLSEATARINGSLEFETVLRESLGGARSLTGARYGLITLVNGSGDARDLLTSGLTAREHAQLMAHPVGPDVFSHLGQVSGPLRIDDFCKYTGAADLAEFGLPLPLEAPVPVLTAPIGNPSGPVGRIHLVGTEPGGVFSPDDEESLVMFTSHLSTVLANARSYRNEQQTRTDLETLIDSSPLAAIVFDASTGRPISLNREARRITAALRLPGARVEERVETMRVRRADGQELSLGELSLSGAPSASATARFERIILQAPDGGGLMTLFNATPLHAPDRQVASVLVTLQAVAPPPDESLAMVSRALREPLAAIKGSTAALLDTSTEFAPTEARELARLISDRADHMRDLIGDLLDVAKTRTDTLPIDPEPVAVAVLADQACSGFRSNGNGRNLHIDVSSDLPQVIVDKRQTVALLDTLLSNAAKTSPPSSPIRLSARHHDFGVTISVSGKGGEATPEHLSDLFGECSSPAGEPADAGVPDTVEGPAQDLATCRRMLRAHGSRIWAETDIAGQETRLSFTVPVAAEQPQDDPAHSASSLRSLEAHGERVLVVDDPRALRHTRHDLARAGYLPIVTGDADDVPRLIRKHRPEAMLLDPMLLGDDGINMMQRILNLVAIPVIVVSADARDDAVARALDAGAVDYIAKPFSPTELSARIGVALRQRPAQDQIVTPEPSRFGDLTVNYATRRVTLAGHPVRLTAVEYNLLAEVSRNAGRVVTHGQLLSRVWGLSGSADLRPMRTAIKSLRRKLRDDPTAPTYIFTERGAGYRMPRPWE